MQNRKVVVALGGASGSIYAKLLLDELEKIKDQFDDVGLVASKNAMVNWDLEIKEKQLSDYSFTLFENSDFNAPFASGSAKYDTMFVVPCSMGLVARIAHGFSNDLISRSADVILKERRKLITIPRETPLSLIHLKNLLALTEAGAIVLPAIPSFYHSQDNVEDLLLTVIHRALDIAGFNINTKRWNS